MMDQVMYDSTTGTVSEAPVRDNIFALGREFGRMGQRAYLKDAFPHLHPSVAREWDLTFVMGRDAGMVERAEEDGRVARAAGEACVVPAGMKGRVGTAWLRGWTGVGGVPVNRQSDMVACHGG